MGEIDWKLGRNTIDTEKPRPVIYDFLANSTVYLPKLFLDHISSMGLIQSSGYHSARSRSYSNLLNSFTMVAVS